MSNTRIDPSAKISEDCTIGENVRIGRDVVLESNVTVENGTVIEAGVTARNCTLRGKVSPYTNWNGRLIGFNPRPQTTDTDPFFGQIALDAILENESFETVLDVGSGAGRQADYFEEKGKTVTRLDFGSSRYFTLNNDQKYLKADFLKHDFSEPFDCVWACHVLEHQPNPGAFIEKLSAAAKPGGLIAVTVPPSKPDVVGGHLSLWHPGLLLYHFVFAGIDCKNARLIRYGYNISLVVRNNRFEKPPLDYDSGDIMKLAEWFPEGIQEPFSGMFPEWNWYR